MQSLLETFPFFCHARGTSASRGRYLAFISDTKLESYIMTPIKSVNFFLKKSWTFKVPRLRVVPLLVTRGFDQGNLCPKPDVSYNKKCQFCAALCLKSSITSAKFFSNDFLFFFPPAAFAKGFLTVFFFLFCKFSV